VHRKIPGTPNLELLEQDSYSFYYKAYFHGKGQAIPVIHPE
jgi:hypothetical protein